MMPQAKAVRVTSQGPGGDHGVSGSPSRLASGTQQS